VSEGIPALGWVTMEPKPAPFVKEMSDAAQFYTNVSGVQQRLPRAAKGCRLPAPVSVVLALAILIAIPASSPTACPEGQP